MSARKGVVLLALGAGEDRLGAKFSSIGDSRSLPLMAVVSPMCVRVRAEAIFHDRGPE